jgi:two-component system chemotaxis response regulator CheB
MPAGFTKMYAERLHKNCKMTVKECQDGDRVEPGLVLIAAGEHHMWVEKDSRGLYVRCQKGEKVSGHCPSVDVLFNSVADVVGESAAGVILTGMGSDGAKGLLRMRRQGAYTIGQDKDTSVVYGMPMASYNIGAVEKQLPLEQIAPELIKYNDREVSER